MGHGPWRITIDQREEKERLARVLAVARNARWIADNKQELIAKVGKDKWIAVWGETLIDSDHDLVRLRERLHREHPKKLIAMAVEYLGDVNRQG